MGEVIGLTFGNSMYFGVVVTLVCYIIGHWIKNRINFVLFNPLLLAVIFIIMILKTVHIEFELYYDGAKYIAYFLTPATVCLALPLYRQIKLLKEHLMAVLIGSLMGVIANMSVIYAFALFYRLTNEMYVTMLPKSITTAIAIGLSEELGGITTITVASIVVTGIVGNVFAGVICRLSGIKEPMAVGLAIGTSSHALGTAKALELGEIEGAMSGLAIAITGLMTVVMASVFSGLIV